MRQVNAIKILTAVSIIFAFDFMIVALIFVEIPKENKDIILHTVGMIDGAFVGSLVGYYYTRSAKENQNGPI